MSNKLVKLAQAAGDQAGCPLCNSGAPPHCFLNLMDRTDTAVDTMAIYHPKFDARNPSHLSLALLMKHMDTLGARVPTDPEHFEQHVPAGTVFS